MKTIYYFFISLLTLLILQGYLHKLYGQVGINTTTPNASSMLDITSTNKGLLVPRMTSAQRAAIPTPATGLMVYETTSNQFFFFDGIIWKPIGSNNSAWSTVGNAGTSAATNFVGTSDLNDLVVRTNNTEKMRITSGGNTGIGNNTPASRLHVIKSGLSGISPFSNSIITAENNNAGYISILTPSTDENGILFGLGGLTSTDGGIIYNNSSNLRGLQFRTNGNNTRMVIDNNGDVGIGTSIPSNPLHVVGNIRMVDGNQATGKVMVSDSKGAASWQDPKITKYHTVIGTTIATAPPTSLTSMPQMNITFTSQGPVVYARFTAAGASLTCGQHSLNFQILLNSVVVQNFQTTIEDITNSLAKIWDVNMEIPVSVVPNSTNTISISWGHIGTSCSNITNGPGSAVAPHGSFRVLTIVEP